jgi:hypothetical protein
MIDKIVELLGSCGSDFTTMPPTELYNEGWMLRLVLDWFASHRKAAHELSFLRDARWYSEALIAPPFLAEKRGDPRAESYTHADGLIGHFSILPGERGEATVMPDAQQLVVIEAKMGSRLSPGVTNARGYDQAARNVACIANLLADAKISPESVEKLGFYVVAPRRQIDSGVFGDLVTKPSIRRKVAGRVAQHGGERDEWFRVAFEPLLQHIDVGVLSWESILDLLEGEGAEDGHREFYSRCLAFNPQRAERAV